MKQLKYLIIMLLIHFMSTGSQAADIAKYAGEFMATGVGARALGMGGAYVAGGQDVTSGYWNPAGLASIDVLELSAMHSERFAGVVNYDYLGAAMPFRSSESFALSGIRLGVDDIPITAVLRPDLATDSSYVDKDGKLVNNRPYIDKMVNHAEYAFYFSYANQKTAAFAYGINAKMIYKGTGVNNAWGIGFDVGVLWNPWKSLRVGMNMQDVTTTILAWDTGTKELISPTLKTGVAYPFNFSLADMRLLIAADVDTRFENRQSASQFHLGTVSFDFRLGGELQIYDVVAIRLGRDDLGEMTAGAGLRFSRLDVDYSYMNHPHLDQTHRISLRLRLEEDLFFRH